MLKNYFKILWRKLWSDKVNSLIHIGGLAVGISAVMILLIYVRFEQSFDADLPESEQLYRVNLTAQTDGDFVETGSRTSPGIGENILKEVSGVEALSRVVILGEVIAGFQDQFIREESIFLTDTEYFDFFDVKMLHGKVATMSEPMQVMISNQISEKIFGRENPVGKTLQINSTNFDGTVDFQVAGVFVSPASNRHLRPEILISYATLHQFIGKEIDQSYDWVNLYTYLKVNPEASITELELAVNENLQRHYGEALESNHSKWDLSLQSVSSIHTSLETTGEYEKGIDGKKLSYFLCIGLFVLLMVYLNSINISNAKALNRAREIGVRKVSGGNKNQLFFQFLFESLVLNFFAVILAGVLIALSGALLNNLLDLGLPASDFQLEPNLQFLVGFWLLGTLFSGIYPAVVLTSISPANALKGALKWKMKSAFSRPLLVSQLVFCLIIIAGVLTVYKQLEFMRGQQLGLTLEDKLVFRSPMLYVEGSGNYQEQLQNSVGSLNSVKKLAATNEIPGTEVYWRSDDFHLEGKEKNGLMYTMLNVGEGYFDVFGIEYLAGRSFNPALENGSEAIINRKALEALGLDNPEEVLGQTLSFGNSGVPIVAVVENYRQQGVNVEVEPLVLNFSNQDLKYYVVDFEKGNAEKVLAEIEDVFQKHYASSPFEYYFLDEHFDRQYKSEQQFVKLFGIASLVAVLIAVMGILGVTNQLVIQRTKEISIRKILGASPSQILNLISGEYVIWLAVCFLVGVPLSYFLLSNWLENFQIQVSLGWWFFALPAISILLIFVLTTLYQTLKAMFTNPSETLKSE